MTSSAIASISFGATSQVDSPVVELSLLVHKDRLKMLAEMAERRNCSVAQLVRSLIDRQIHSESEIEPGE